MCSPCARYLTHGEGSLRRGSGCRRRFAVGHPRRNLRRVLNGLRRVPLAHGELGKSGSGCIGTGACGGTDTCIIRSTVINQLDDGYMVNYAVEPKTTNTIIEQQDEDWMHRSDSWIMDVPPPSHEGTFAGLI